MRETNWEFFDFRFHSPRLALFLLFRGTAIVQVLLYEFTTGGGCYWDESPFPPTRSLMREGTAMIRALAQDFLEVEGAEVIVFKDSRLSRLDIPATTRIEIRNGEHEQDQLARVSAESDWTILIAPESHGQLWQRSCLVERAGGRLLSPCSAVVELASDKQLTIERWESAGVSSPVGRVIHSMEEVSKHQLWPAVIKPRNGAGSVGVRLAEGPDDVGAIDFSAPEMRIEQYAPGIPVSVSLLCGNSTRIALPACEQKLSRRRFEYRGGRVLRDEAASARARLLAQRACSIFPNLVGYVGIDMVLGASEDGNDDAAIEMNPRLTTSYVGLRRAIVENMAAAMLSLAEGKEVALTIKKDLIEFDSQGCVEVTTVT